MRILLRNFVKLESSGGIVLFFTAMLAMFWANSPLAYLRDEFIHVSLFWINEGLMAIFFFLVGLELKRGFVEGEMSSFSQISLPAVAAVGGMLAPALIYVACNLGNTVALKGWATPVATDIAFAVGVLSLFSRRVPPALKLFLLAVAIFDDIGAILIIVFFYSQKLTFLYFAGSLLLLVCLWAVNASGIRKLVAYIFLGMGLWLCLLHSGIHPTIAGVLAAFAIPDGNTLGYSPLRWLEKTLHPWVVYLVMPLFALANAGFSLGGINQDVLTDGIVVGIVLGLVIGKPIGVMSFSWLMVKLKVARLPSSVTWSQILGVSLLCGIGFTMSLFLGTLSFQHHSVYLLEVRLGVLMGSSLAGLLGAFFLSRLFKMKSAQELVDC